MTVADHGEGPWVLWIVLGKDFIENYQFPLNWRERTSNLYDIHLNLLYIINVNLIGCPQSCPQSDFLEIFLSPLLPPFCSKTTRECASTVFGVCLPDF